jgi:HEAT repeat protein
VWACAWGGASDVSLSLLLWSCVVIFGLVGLVALQLVIVHSLAAARRRAQKQLESQWLPLLVAAVEEVPQRLPAIAAHDMPALMSLWNHLHDSIKDLSVEALHQIAVRTGMDVAAQAMFAQPAVPDRVLAITTLGRLRDRSIWPALVALASHQDLLLSLAAARALVRIDPAEAIRLLLPIVATREDWPAATIDLMMQEAGADAISEPLVDAILHAPPDHAHRLIRFLGLAHAEAAAPLLKLLIRQVTSVESISACLRAFNDGEDLGAIRPFLFHPRWEVRVRAVDVLGRLGAAKDAPRLIAMLSDAEWWVRYRAAQALCSLLSSDLGRVKRLQATHGDPFARDMLTHVLAEQDAM